METEPKIKKERKPRAKKAETLQQGEILLSAVEPVRSSPIRKITPSTELFDWKSLIPSQFIEVSSHWQAQNGIDPSKVAEENKQELKEKCGEENLIIKLAGFKHLAHLRGLLGVSYEVRTIDKDNVFAVCNLHFSDAELTDDKGVTSFFPEQRVAGVANANVANTSYPYSMFLESMAENRSFIRAVKMACNINILGAEELQTQESPTKIGLLGEEGCTSPQESLSLMLAGINKGFVDLKESLNKKAWPNSEEWVKFEDIPSDQCMLLMEGIRAKK